jgi:hypothetical protein
MEKLFDTVQRRFMEHFIYAAYAFIESAENEDGFGKKKKSEIHFSNSITFIFLFLSID